MTVSLQYNEEDHQICCPSVYEMKSSRYFFYLLLILFFLFFFCVKIVTTYLKIVNPARTTRLPTILIRHAQSKKQMESQIIR